MIREPDANQVVWLDGEFIAWRNATKHLCDHHYGFGVFEGVRAYAVDDRVGVFRLTDHTRRLFQSAHILGIRMPENCDVKQLDGVQLELLRRNELRDAYLRPFVYYGGTNGLSPRGQDLTVHVAVIALGWVDGNPATDGRALQRGISVRCASMVRSFNATFTKAKACANYMTGMLALQEARACGADDALLCDQNGFVTEASAANLFVVRDGKLYTPPRSAALEGITRDTVMTLARAAGFDVLEQRISREDLYIADEAFLTGTAVGLTPIREADGRSVGGALPGPISRQLAEMYHSCVRGRTRDHRDWLTSC